MIKEPISPKEIAAFCERLDRLKESDLTTELKIVFTPELTKLRGVAYQKLKLCK